MDAPDEVINGVHVVHQHGREMHQDDFDEQVRLPEYLEGHWRESGCGSRELGNHIASHTHSQVMAWVAADRVATFVERLSFEGDAKRWRALADHIHASVCENGFDKKRNTVVQRYGTTRSMRRLCAFSSSDSCPRTTHACSAPPRPSKDIGAVTVSSGVIPTTTVSCPTKILSWCARS